MRRAQPHELKTRAVPIMTARISEAELKEWVPICFDDIDGPLEAAEPSKGALVELNRGGYVVLYYGKESKQLTLEVPEAAEDCSAVLAGFLDEVPLPRSRVLWHRSDVQVGEMAEGLLKSTP